ncbi:SGNH/GDSL hydrolase family protein [Pseudomonas sp. MS-1(2024)]|uniref:SGNH/GDSL hydrolase family protein n=1 Tax=Pseudomonas sp. MS-1(2024) TaxID=3112251 RepID=UPI002DBB2725|nr:SGNH/GDSL hydrolase family protein [Pseudomonas sp. MS-1(2024)]MEC4168338.1 SGNH/GDSL hydrolase family protein [Pseudomonas sp. MS-1(2024)]
MAVQSGPTFKRYAANGAATVYTIPFLLLDPANLQITLNGVSVTSGFTLAGLGNASSSCTFAVAPVGDLLFQQVMQFQRLTDYQMNGDFLSQTVNGDYDRLWLAIKQLNRDDGRALAVSPLEPEGIPALPVKALRNLKLLAFDAQGNPAPSNLTLVQLEQQPALALESAAAAKASALEASNSELQANNSAAVAIDEAGKAESAAQLADIALGTARVFPDVATGLLPANTASGQFFSAPSPLPDEYIILYKNNNRVGEEIKRYPSIYGVPKTGVEGVYNLVNPSAPVTSGLGLNGSNDYTGVATVKSLAIRVTAGQPIVISNPAGNYLAYGGYGAAFFSDLPAADNKVAAFNGLTLTNLAGLTYRADVVPAGAKYLVLNTEFQGVQNNWFAAYDTIFTGVEAFEAAVARMDGQQVFDRKLNRKFVAAFSAAEGADNLHNPGGLLVGYLSSAGLVRRDNAAWRYVKIPVVEGRTYALYTSLSTWNFPVMGSYGVAGGDPAGSPIATLGATTDPLVRTFTVPKGQGITHFFFNVVLTPPGGNFDFTTSLIVQEGLTVPVRPLPYKPVLAQINDLPLKDARARSALIDLNAALSQRTGRYNLLDPAAPVVSDFGITGTTNYSPLPTAKSIAIPVTEGLPIVIATPRNNYLAFGGYGAVFYSSLPATDNLTRIRSFSDPLSTAPTLTNSGGLTYRKDVVPAGAKYLVLNTEFQGIQHDWFVAYDVGFTAPSPYLPTITEFGGVPFTDRETQILAREISRLVSRRFTGKKVYYFGDSITEGGGGGFPSYTKRITDILQCEGTNYGSSGAWSSRLVGIMTNLNPRDGTAKRVTPDYTDVAAITIMIGSNDAGTTGAGINGSLASIPSQRIQDLPFTTAGGVLVSTPDEYWALFPNTYYGNLSLCIEYVKWKNPLTAIYLISATHREPSIVPMDAVVAAMTAIARFYSVQYFNATHECGVDFKNIRTYSYDGLHPNEQGVERIGKYVGYRMLHS